MTKQVFMFRIVYFKPSGKFYTEENVGWEVMNCGPEGHSTAYMDDAIEKIKSCRRTGVLLPGLSSGKWDGPILIDCPDGYPCLILPEEK